ncbi:MAG: hypothetical protein CMH36_08705 [Microbacterium sp.]|jgi:dienelactone hydrolase|uniref:dienelactone hydrolase family protein n=1 Tax=uncultured Microbacterium sp. TaxID=191216 RepID=UPI000C8E6F5B|nr:dienelactone hydrolase family protein [Microbacterium bovistercoris]MAL06891.1 hypothetical protein [Microbacterium sp.]MBN9208029.1 dienelactone hydrolase family protein [Microbacterium ginsengisoli]|tara:strand:+ start:469 stop:675 length:207 start_codon:yes stop_codon:yes gene_type:complete
MGSEKVSTRTEEGYVALVPDLFYRAGSHNPSLRESRSRPATSARRTTTGSTRHEMAVTAGQRRHAEVG